MNDRPITPAEFEWFERDQARRLMRDDDRSLVDALGNPLMGTSMGTFSNIPDPKLTLDAMAAAARQVEELIAVSRPKRFEFGDVSVAGFWIRIQKIEFVESDGRYGGGMGEILVTSQVPDRDTGAPIEITFKNIISIQAWNSPRRADIIRQTIRSWLHHEIDEHIFSGGRRAFEPHNDPPLAFLEPELPGDNDFMYRTGYRRSR